MNLRQTLSILAGILACACGGTASGQPAGAKPVQPILTVNRALQRTCFQAAAPCSDAIDIRTDVAVAYGVDDSLTTPHRRVEAPRVCAPCDDGSGVGRL